MSTVNPSGRDIAPHNRPPQDAQWTEDPAPQYSEYDYDPSASFAALRLNDQPPSRSTTLNADPIPRGTSAMSFRSVPAGTHGPPPRHAMTLPAPTSHGHPLQQTASVYSDHSSVPSQHPENGAYDDYDPLAYYGDQQAGYGTTQGYSAQDGYQQPVQYQQYPQHQYTYPQQHTHMPPQHLSPHMPPPQQQPHWQGPVNGGFNPLHAAATDVLGMSLPPGGAMRSPPPPSLGGPVPSDRSMYAGSVSSGYAGSVSSGHSGSSGQMHYPADPYAQKPEFERPDYQRAGTSGSVAPSSVKQKAIALSAPPYTKDYIDQYRQRIKADPDPEAHFLYAKYLIDAAKHIRTTHKDERSAKKYSELLIAESLKVIRKLATQGETYSEAQFFLANCYGTGALGLQVDHERAYHLYLQAAKQDHAAACYRIAVCNEIGAGTKKMPDRAASFYKKAATLGDTPAMYRLGMILLNGNLGQETNHRQALFWLNRAAEQADEDNPHALHELATLYEQRNDIPVPYDPVRAKTLFTQAGQLGYVPSQLKLGQCYEYGSLSCPVDPKRSIAWYTKAAEKGDAQAELSLSGWYLTGSEGVLKQSDSEAYLWARRAGNKCFAKAEYAVGYYAEVGIGIKQDMEIARKWYMRAAAQGNQRAMSRLTEMKRMGAKRAQMARPTRQQAKDECVIC